MFAAVAVNIGKDHVDFQVLPAFSQPPITRTAEFSRLLIHGICSNPAPTTQVATSNTASTGISITPKNITQRLTFSFIAQHTHTMVKNT